MELSSLNLVRARSPKTRVTTSLEFLNAGGGAGRCTPGTIIVTGGMGWVEGGKYSGNNGWKLKLPHDPLFSGTSIIVIEAGCKEKKLCPSIHKFNFTIL